MTCCHRILILFASLFLLSGPQAKAVTASFTADHPTGCAPQVVNFTNSSSGASTYYWDFGNGYTSVLTNPSTSYTSTGTYTVKLIATSSTGSKDSTTLTITVYDVPLVKFTGDSIGCKGASFHYYDSSTLYSSGSGTYLWNFGDGNTSTSKNPTYTYNLTGTYTITLSVTNSVGCSSFLRKTGWVSVVGPPTVNFTADTTLFCGPNATGRFNNLSTGGSYTPLTYAWSFGDGGTSTSTSPTHGYTSYGSYNVKLVVTNSVGCKDSLTRPGYINSVSETANFNLSATSICPGVSVSVTNTSTPSYTNSYWDFGDGFTSTLNSLTHAYTTAGTYTIKLVSKYGCTDSTTKSVTVNPKPTANFTDTPANPCPAPTSIYYVNLSTGGATYYWDFGNSTSSTLANPIKVYTKNFDSTFNVKLVVTTTNGCKDSVTKSVHIKILPLRLRIYGNGDSGSTGGCQSLTVNFSYRAFSDTPLYFSPVTYPYAVSSTNWDFGDGGTSTSGSPSHTYTSAGNYTVVLTINTINGCSKTDTFIVHVGTLPSATFGADILNACPGVPITFTDTATGATSFSWYFGETGGGGTTTSNTYTYKFKYPGLHTISLTAYNNGCGYTFTRTNYINIDSASAIFTYRYSCDTNLRINFTNNSIGASTYNWDFGDATTSTTSATNFFHIYPASGTYNVRLIIHNNTSGCSDTATLPIIVYDPHASFTATDTMICLNASAHFTSTFTGGVLRPTTGYPSAHTTPYTWVFDGTTTLTDTSAAIDHVYTTRGYHTVKIIMYDNRNGGTCKDTFTRVSYIGVAKPITGFYATPIPVCGLLPVLFRDTSTDITGVSVTNRAWTFGDGFSSSVTTDTTTHIYTLASNYNVRLITTDNIGCKDTLTKNTYIQVQKPVANFGASTTSACRDATVTFSNASSGSPSTSTWYFGDGGTATTTGLTGTSHIYRTAGTYTVKLVIANALGCMDSLTRTNYITINPKPVAAFTMSDTVKICAPMPVNFSDITSGGSSYAWDFGDIGGTSTSKNTSWTYLSAGSYTIRDIVTNTFGCKDTAYGTVHLLGYSGALSYTPLLGCRSLFVNFSSLVTSGVPDFIFDFGDGVTFSSSTPSASHTYIHPGKYLPKIIFTNDSGCSSYSSGIDTIRVDTLWPGIRFTPRPICDSGDVQFYDTSRAPYSSISKRRWVFHDGSISTIANPVKHYPGPGTYAITLYDTSAGGCTTRLDTSITIYPFPKFAMDDTFNICPPMKVKFTDITIGGSSYIWDYGDPLAPGPGTGKTTSWTYTKAGYYTIKEIVTNVKGCIDTAYGTVHVLGLAGDLHYNPLKGCKPLTVNFNSVVTWGVPKYIYDFGDGSSFTGSSPITTHTYVKSGYYIPQVTFTNDSGCSATSLGLDTIFIDGIHPGYLTLPGTLCDSGNIELVDTSTSLYSSITGHRWIFEDGSKASGITAFHKYHAAGTYPVIIIDSTAWGCKDTGNLTITINASPIINAGLDTTICVGDAANLLVSGASTYIWSPTATLSCATCASTTATPAVATAYAVKGTDINGCSDRDTVEVFIKTKTSSVIGPGGEICKGDSVQLSDSAGYNASYVWIPADGLNNDHIANPVARPEVTTTYTVAAKQGSCLSDTQSVTVTVHPTPVVYIIPNDTTVIAGNNVQLIVGGTNINTYLWRPDQSLGCIDCYNPLASPHSTTHYWLTVHSDFGCADSTEAIVHVICDQSQVYMPNTFTPNGDGHNDRFYPRGKGIQIVKSFRIYNRWGQVVFEQQNIQVNDKNFGWDGTFKAVQLTPDVFVYIMDAICYTGEPVTIKGNITLVR